MNNNYIRALIRINSQHELIQFMEKFYDVDDTFIVEDFKGTQRANVRSMIGLMYAFAEFGSEMYIVNTTNDGYFPGFIDAYRKDASD